jgi:hypothetical protein
MHSKQLLLSLLLQDLGVLALAAAKPWETQLNDNSANSWVCQARPGLCMQLSHCDYTAQHDTAHRDHSTTIVSKSVSSRTCKTVCGCVWVLSSG